MVFTAANDVGGQIDEISILWEYNFVFMQTICVASDHQHGRHANHLLQVFR